MTDFRALCAELVNELEAWQEADDLYSHGGTIRDDADYDLAPRVRAELDKPVEQGPTHDELNELWDKEAEYYALYGEAWRFAHAVLARWGRPAAPAVKPIPVSERLPEDADCLVIPPLGTNTSPLRYCWMGREIMHCGQARLLWDWKLVPHTTQEHWPFTYWLPASTQFLPTTVDPARVT
jgi:hypothetical protein